MQAFIVNEPFENIRRPRENGNLYDDIAPVEGIPQQETQSKNRELYWVVLVDESEISGKIAYAFLRKTDHGGVSCDRKKEKSLEVWTYKQRKVISHHKHDHHTHPCPARIERCATVGLDNRQVSPLRLSGSSKKCELAPAEYTKKLADSLGWDKITKIHNTGSAIQNVFKSSRKRGNV